jgi:hypothetical protein
MELDSTGWTRKRRLATTMGQHEGLPHPNRPWTMEHFMRHRTPQPRPRKEACNSKIDRGNSRCTHPLPDPAPYTLPEVAKLYETKANTKSAAAFSVDPHRFALKHLQPILDSEAFDTQVHVAKSAELATMGLSFE